MTTDTVWWFRSLINFLRRASFRKYSMPSLAPSDRYDKAQLISVIISSLSFSVMTFVKDGMALFTSSKSGVGLPLQRFERAQEQFLMKGVPDCAWSRTYAILFRAPLFRTQSLVIGQSPAIFPRPHITCSTTSKCGEFNSCMKCVTTSFSIKLLT